MKSGALFLDRDGTLIVDADYLHDPAGVRLLPGVPAALRHARELGYRLYLFTNQSGVGRGLFTLDAVHRCNRRLLELLALGPDVFAATCIAPEAPDQPSAYRKPSPRFITEMIARDHLDRRHCHMVGDRDSDVRAGLAAGIGAVAVCTGKYDAATWAAKAPPEVRVFPDLPAFVASLPPLTPA